MSKQLKVINIISIIILTGCLPVKRPINPPEGEEKQCTINTKVSIVDTSTCETVVNNMIHHAPDHADKVYLLNVCKNTFSKELKRCIIEANSWGEITHCY